MSYTIETPEDRVRIVNEIRNKASKNGDIKFLIEEVDRLVFERDLALKMKKEREEIRKMKNACHCPCHTMAGVKHIIPCCEWSNPL